MPYNPQYDEQTFSADELATSTKQNKVRNNIKHNQLYKPQLGPDAPTNPQIKLATGLAEITFPGGSGSATVTVNFASDSDHGDPGFTNTPRIVVSQRTPPSTGNLNITDIYTTDETNSSFKIKVTTYLDLSPPASGAKAYFTWYAIGN